MTWKVLVEQLCPSPMACVWQQRRTKIYRLYVENSTWQIEQRLPQVSRDLFNGKLESVLHYKESYPSFSESLLHSKVHNYSILELPQRGWELARLMKTENFLGSSAHPLENSEGTNLCFRNPWALFKWKSPPSWQHGISLSCLFQWSPGCFSQPSWHGGNITFKSLCTISCWWMWFTLSSIWWIQWLKDKGKDIQLCTRTHTLGISSHPRTVCLAFIFVSGRVQDPMLNPFAMSTGWRSSVPSQLDTHSTFSNRMINTQSIAGPQSLPPTSHHLLPFFPLH